MKLKKLLGSLGFIAIFAFLNRVRGGGFFRLTRGLVYLAMGVALAALTWLFGYSPIEIGAITAIGIGGFAWASARRWGKYFSSFTGVWSIADGIPWINSLLEKLLGKYDASWSKPKIRLYGTIGFTCIGLYYYPIFILLSYWNLWYLLYGLSVLTMGLVYWTTKFTNWEKMGNTYPEIMYGIVFATTIAMGL